MKRIIIEQFKRLITHDLISGSFYLFLGAMVANILSLLANLIFVRKLSVIDYGIYSTLISLMTLVMIPSQSLNTVIVQFATHFFSKGEIGKGVKFYRNMGGVIVAIVLVILFLTLAFAPGLGKFLHIETTWYLILTGLSVCITYLAILNSGYLQSLLRFRYMGMLLIIGGVAKLLFGFLFLDHSMSVVGALWAVFLSFFIPFLLSFFPLRIVFKKPTGNFTIHAKEVLVYAVPASITVFALQAFTSVDVILSKHFFTAIQAGAYAGLSTVGRIIFYFTGTIPLVMFPLVIKRFTKGESYKGIFYLSLLLVLIPSVGITLCYFLFPNLVVTIVLGGKKYFSIASYLGIMGVYLTIFSVINIYITFFLSLRKTIVAIPTVVAAVLQIVLISLFHANFYQVIGVSIASAVCLLVTVVSMFHYTWRAK